jgi:hypothetical protein
MKYPVRRFKSLAIALKEIEPHVRNGRPVQTGKPFGNFADMRPREVLANMLICTAANFESEPERFRFVSTEDPIGGDGVIEDTQTEDTFPTEHVLVPDLKGGAAEDIQALILGQIALKQNKGKAAYAAGKTLLYSSMPVGGPWFPNRVAKSLPKPLDFAAVWVVGLHGAENAEYLYDVMQLDQEAGTADIWRVRIAADFNSWQVERVQWR